MTRADAATAVTELAREIRACDSVIEKADRKKSVAVRKAETARDKKIKKGRERFNAIKAKAAASEGSCAPGSCTLGSSA